MNVMEQRKYVFKKPYLSQEGTIPEGSEIILFRETIYLNGGMVHPAYQSMLRRIVNNPTLKEQYLKEVAIIKNKV